MNSSRENIFLSKLSTLKVNSSVDQEHLSFMCNMPQKICQSELFEKTVSLTLAKYHLHVIYIHKSSLRDLISEHIYTISIGKRTVIFNVNNSLMLSNKLHFFIFCIKFNCFYKINISLQIWKLFFFYIFMKIITFKRLYLNLSLQIKACSISLIDDFYKP